VGNGTAVAHPLLSQQAATSGCPSLVNAKKKKKKKKNKKKKKKKKKKNKKKKKKKI
jgi:hypothetical protein